MVEKVERKKTKVKIKEKKGGRKSVKGKKKRRHKKKKKPTKKEKRFQKILIIITISSKLLPLEELTPWSFVLRDRV